MSISGQAWRKACAFITVLFICAIFFNVSPAQAAVSFPAGTYVVPMDNHQANRIQAFGIINRILNNGGQIRRILESDAAPGVTLKTNANPGGASYQGGFVLVSSAYAAAVAAAQGAFPAVTVETLTEAYTASSSYLVTKATRILVVHGTFGHTDATLTAMGVPYTLKEPLEVRNNVSIINGFDLVVDDCPGGVGMLSDDLKNALISFARNGGELIFTDIALLDLNQTFPGYVQVVSNVNGTFSFTNHNNGDFITQFYGTSPFSIFTLAGGNIVSGVSDPSVKVFLDSANYGGNYRIGGFYFPYGSGIVEGLAFHPADQTGEAQILTSFIFGNKFIHTIETQPSDPLPYTGR